MHTCLKAESLGTHYRGGVQREGAAADGGSNI